MEAKVSSERSAGTAAPRQVFGPLGRLKASFFQMLTWEQELKSVEEQMRILKNQSKAHHSADLLE